MSSRNTPPQPTLRWSISAAPFALALALAPGLGCAEDEPTRFEITVENITPSSSIYDVRALEATQPDADPDTLEPGESWRCVVPSAPGARLQILAKLSGFDDAYVALEPGGMPMWSYGLSPLAPMEGDRSDILVVFDAGSGGDGEVASPPHQGPVTRLRQGGEGGEADPDASLMAMPAVEDLFSLRTRELGDWSFEVTVENLATPDKAWPNGLGEPRLIGGVCVVLDENARLFEIGSRASDELLALAEDGDPEPLITAIREGSGIASDLSAVLWAKHDGDGALYDPGEFATPGLEHFAEDAFALTRLHEIRDDATFDDFGLVLPLDGWTMVPGERVRFQLEAYPGDRLTVMSAYLAANDYIVGTGRTGIPLFDQGVPNVGAHDEYLELVDVGTEVDEAPGLGPNQYIYQPDSGGGWLEGIRAEVVDGEDDGWLHPRADEVMRVTIEIVD